MSTIYVDSGRAWGTVLGGFVANFLLGGLGKSYGLIKEAFQEIFNCGSAPLLLAGGLIYTLMYCLAILVHYLSERFGRRIVVLTGAFGSFFSLLIAAYAPNIVVWVIAIGVGLGSSLSCIYFSIFSVVGQCFHRYLGMANGLSVAGVSVGQMAFPALITYLDRTYGTRLSATVIAVFSLHLAITAVLMPRYIVSQHPDTEDRRVEKPAGKSGDKSGDKSTLLTSDSEADEKPGRGQQTKKTRRLRRRLVWLHRRKTAAAEGATLATVEQGDGVEQQPLFDRHMTADTDVMAVDADPTPSSVTAEGDVQGGQVIKDSVELVCVEPSGADGQPASLTKTLLIIYILAKVFADIGDISVSFLAPSHGNHLGLSQELVSHGIAFSGLFDLAARLGVGWITDRPCCAGRRGLLLAVTWLLEGVNALAFSQLHRFVVPNAVGLAPSKSLLVAYYFCFGIHGITSGTAMTQMVVVLTDWVGKVKMPYFLAITMFVLGLVISPGQYAMGYLVDVTGDYVLSLRLCCVILLLGGVILLFEFPSRWYFERGAGRGWTVSKRSRQQSSVTYHHEKTREQSGLSGKGDDGLTVPVDRANGRVWDVSSSDSDGGAKLGTTGQHDQPRHSMDGVGAAGDE